MTRPNPLKPAALVLVAGLAAAVAACSAAPPSGSGKRIASNADAGRSSTQDDEFVETPEEGAVNSASCALPASTYASKETVRAGGSEDCPPGMDYDLEIDSEGKSPSISHGESCKVTTDPQTCKTTIDCKSTQSGLVSEVHWEYTTNADGWAKGLRSAKQTAESSGETVMACAYDFTWAKK